MSEIRLLEFACAVGVYGDDDGNWSSSGRICLGRVVILGWDGIRWNRLRFVEMRGFEIAEEKGGKSGRRNRLAVEVEILIPLRVKR